MIYKSLPNILSLFRIVMSPLFIFFMVQDKPYFLLMALFLVFILSITDFFDGYYARKYNLITDLGKYLDPLADKIFVLTVLFTFHFVLGNDIFPLWMIVLILLRDVFVTLMRNILKSKNYNFNTSALAKNKTLIQILCIHFILVILIVNEFNIFLINYSYIYYIMLFCTFMTLLSGFDYILKYFFRKHV